MYPPIEQLLNECIVYASCIEELDIVTLQALLHKNSFACIRGLVSAEQVLLSRLKLAESFNISHDRPTVGEPPDAVQTNFQKLLIGGQNHSGNYVTRFFRTFYNPIWEKDIYSMHSVFQTLIKVRNICSGMPQDFALTTIESNGLWSATRIHQYPIGGGYFEQHKDNVLTRVARESNVNFYQVILNMTSLGTDFEKGGGFVVLNGSKIVFERDFQIGDVIIYNEETLHGVDEIDSHKNLILDKICGRLTAFVSLYRDIRA